MSLPIASAFPELDASLARLPLASLPTPVDEVELTVGKTTRRLWIKRDDISATLYGGNKVRKLEYLLARALARGATRVATFGAVASNHALATAIYARQLGIDCTCLLGHQATSKKARRVLEAHVNLGSELVYYGGSYRTRIQTMRRHVQGRNCCVIPVGGSSWLGSIGFVNAAFELSKQIAEERLPCPDVIYIATGTMGTAAGLALGLALANLPTRVEAVRVTEERFANRVGLRRLMDKIALMMRNLGARIPEGAAEGARVCLRDDFFGGGYGTSNQPTERAVSLASEQLQLRLETTYTGKAMAALLHDVVKNPASPDKALFWDTYNSRPLPESTRGPIERDQLPEAFRRYFV